MSSTPRETERHPVDLSREQRWVVHHVLADRAEESIDAGDRPPAWLVDLFERIESGPATITTRQATRLEAALAVYAAAEGTPDRDRPVASAVVDELVAIDA
ncbi:hypothetical protein [Halovivax sp.]|uniref:DUF7853 family protein n=1 Tax=Halovivax sp. TaxID=1935978 RepID=UPI0025BF6921|nr:hypothetical protein [Halovivax sp.]